MRALKTIILSNFVEELIGLSNAQQSSTLELYNCAGGKCTAEKAIDDNFISLSITRRGKPSWWSAELENKVQIEIILVYIGAYSFKYYNRFQVETGLQKDVWEVCKGPYEVQRPLTPHYITCDKIKIAKYIRMSQMSEMLALTEVKVVGIIQGKIHPWKRG